MSEITKQQENLHTSRNISLKTRKNLLKTYCVWIIAPYGFQTLTILIEEREKLFSKSSLICGTIEECK